MSRSDDSSGTLSPRALIRASFISVISLTVLTGCVFPLVLFTIAKLFPSQAAGSLVTRDGLVIGSRVIGQNFHQPEYFHPRPSAAGSGYDAASSGGTNFAPSHPKLIGDVKKRAEEYRRTNGLPMDATIPIDAVTSSGSGLDPHISPENAALQVARVARARGVSEDHIRSLVKAHTQEPQLGFMGNRLVSVLDLNLDLDQAAPMRHQ